MFVAASGTASWRPRRVISSVASPQLCSRAPRRAERIVSNPADGVWVFARYLESPRDPALVGQEAMIFAQDVVEVRPAG